MYVFYYLNLFRSVPCALPLGGGGFPAVRCSGPKSFTFRDGFFCRECFAEKVTKRHATWTHTSQATPCCDLSRKETHAYARSQAAGLGRTRTCNSMVLVPASSTLPARVCGRCTRATTHVWSSQSTQLTPRYGLILSTWKMWMPIMIDHVYRRYVIEVLRVVVR